MGIRCALLLAVLLLQASAPYGTAAPRENVDLIVIEKSAHTMTLMSKGNALKTYHVALSTVPVGQKERAGDHKVPEGKYTIDEKSRRAGFILRCTCHIPMRRIALAPRDWALTPVVKLKFMGWKRNMRGSGACNANMIGRTDASQ